MGEEEENQSKDGCTVSKNDESLPLVCLSEHNKKLSNLCVSKWRVFMHIIIL